VHFFEFLHEEYEREIYLEKIKVWDEKE